MEITEYMKYSTVFYVLVITDLMLLINVRIDQSKILRGN